MAADNTDTRKRIADNSATVAANLDIAEWTALSHKNGAACAHAMNQSARCVSINAP
jgi:hypothetical protein